MLEVDRGIEVGVVGTTDGASWSNWSNEVIFAGGDSYDFYSLHDYGFSASPSGADAVRRPSRSWETIMTDVRELTSSPIAVTEYNLVSFEAGDTERATTRAMNALYIGGVDRSTRGTGGVDRQPMELRERHDHDDQDRLRAGRCGYVLEVACVLLARTLEPIR